MRWARVNSCKLHAGTDSQSISELIFTVLQWLGLALIKPQLKFTPALPKASSIIWVWYVLGIICCADFVTWIYCAMFVAPMFLTPVGHTSCVISTSRKKIRRILYGLRQALAAVPDWVPGYLQMNCFFRDRVLPPLIEPLVLWLQDDLPTIVPLGLYYKQCSKPNKTYN